KRRGTEWNRNGAVYFPCSMYLPRQSITARTQSPVEDPSQFNHLERFDKRSPAPQVIWSGHPARVNTRDSRAMGARMLVLGIETSCDETAAAVVEGRTVRSDVVHSQVSLHAEYGGVVPELASRDHLINARPVIEQALQEAEVAPEEIDAVCVTSRPGLSGALWIGTQIASALAWAIDRPLIGVDHLVGHLLAVYLEFPGCVAVEPPDFPYLGLLASGGHTALYRVGGPSHTQIVELGATRDDAAGEAYDKVA